MTRGNKSLLESILNSNLNAHKKKLGLKRQSFIFFKLNSPPRIGLTKHIQTKNIIIMSVNNNIKILSYYIYHI